ALGPGEVLVELIEVLWTAERNGVARRSFQVAWENIRETGARQIGNCARTEQARRNRSGAQRLHRTVEAVVVELGRTHDIRAEYVGEVEVQILVIVGLPGVIAGIRAVVNGAGEVVLMEVGITAVDRGLIGPVVINTIHVAPGILRIST